MLRILHWTRRRFLSDELRRLADGRYELFEAIGSGGMATVYRAQDHRLGVARAIKVLLPAYASKDRVRARFEAEARTMAVLDHPNIVRVYDVGASSKTDATNSCSSGSPRYLVAVLSLRVVKAIQGPVWPSIFSNSGEI